MGPLVPFSDELFDLGGQFGQIGEVRMAQALAAQDAEPLLDRIHPGAVHRREVGHEAWMLRQPGPDQLAVMDRDVIAEQMDHADRGRDVPVELLQKLARIIHRPWSAVSGGESEME
jgi:hypothetical protein